MQITGDLIILIALGLGLLYGYTAGRNKVTGIVVYLYISLVVTQLLSSLVYDFVANFGFVSANLATSEFGVSIILFLITFILLMFKSELTGLDSAGSISKMQAALMGLLIATFIIVCVISFMDETQRINLNSNFALLAYNFRAAILVAPVLYLIVLPFFGKKK